LHRLFLLFNGSARLTFSTSLTIQELDKVCDELMSMELRQVEKFEAMVDEFDNRLVETKTAALEMQGIFFRSVEELEDKFVVNIRGVITDLIERLAREELAEDFLDEAAMSLLMDRETTMGVAGSSHDMHLSRILKREDEARNAETKRYQEAVHGHMNAEKSRNRNRVLEIHDFCRACKVNITSLLLNDDDEEGDEEAK
jgi:predicted RecB family endonuclease